MIKTDDTLIKTYGWICPNCGTVLSPSTLFCPFCISKPTDVITSATGTGSFIANERKEKLRAKEATEE